MSAQWAKFPSKWIRTHVDEESGRYALSELTWRDHGGSAIAALCILMSLAIRLNQSNKQLFPSKGVVRPTTVAVSYEDLRQMTGFAKSAIARGLSILEAWKAIETAKVGRENKYRLLGLDEPGAWCQLPQASLIKGSELLLKPLPRNRATLNATKVYLVLLALRNRELNTAAISYSKITDYTGVRREDIAQALGILATMNLIRRSDGRDFRHAIAGANDQSNRYRIIGLGFDRAPETDDLERAAAANYDFGSDVSRVVSGPERLPVGNGRESKRAPEP
jgi:hypothetical protein